MKGMPRGVFTYPESPGWRWLNMISTIGVFTIATEFAVFVYDLLRSKKHQGVIPRNPWGAGTLEFSPGVPEEAWGVRSIQHITTRYPLWGQDNLVERMEAGHY